MTVLRAHAVTLTNTASSALRVHAVSLAAVVDPVPRIRVHKASLAGTPATVILPSPARSIGPGESQNVTMVIEDGVPADTWDWRIISGPSVALAGTADTRTLTGPHLWNQWNSKPDSSPPEPALTRVGVRATRDGIVSDEVVIEVTTLPQGAWTRKSGGTWKGARTAVA